MKKRSIAVAGHRTSISLEDAFWQAVQDMAGERGLSLPALVAEIDGRRDPEVNLSSAIRLAVLEWARTGSRTTSGAG